MPRFFGSHCLWFATALMPLHSEASNPRLCPSDRPCILPVYNARTNLIVERNDTERLDHDNARWSRPGKESKQRRFFHTKEL